MRRYAKEAIKSFFEKAKHYRSSNAPELMKTESAPAYHDVDEVPIGWKIFQVISRLWLAFLAMSVVWFFVTMWINNEVPQWDLNAQTIRDKLAYVFGAIFTVVSWFGSIPFTDDGQP